jgi:hypothetical protein
MEVSVSELTQRSPTASATNNEWSKNAADSARHDSVTSDRADEQAVAAARGAVAKYLGDVGLCDPELIARESHEIVARARREPTFTRKEAPLSEAAIQLTVKQLDRWLVALTADSRKADELQRPGGVAGSRLPDLLSRYPQAWKESRPSAELVESLREDLTPVVPEPRPVPMRPQTVALMPSALKRLRCRIAQLFGREPDPGDNEPGAEAPNVSLSRRMTARVLLALRTILTTIFATWMFCRVAARDGLGVVGYALAVLFAVLLSWVAFSFWVATLGLIVQLQRGSHVQKTVAVPMDLPPTAVVMPIHNENPRNVFANIRAIAQSLRETGNEAAFGIFVLSDTTDPDIWLEEEREWAKLVASCLPNVECFIGTGRRTSDAKLATSSIFAAAGEITTGT